MLNEKCSTLRPEALPPQRLEQLLKSSQGQAALAPSVRRRLQAELTERRRRLLHLVCSEPWFSECWRTGRSFPPPADTTPMLPCGCGRCRAVGKLWPSIYCVVVETEKGLNAKTDGLALLSFECYLESMPLTEAAHLPSSPSGLALRAVREGRIKIRRTRTRYGRGRKFP